MSRIHNLAVAAMPTTVLLFPVPIWPRGHHLPLVRNWVKVTAEAHVWVPTYFKWCIWSILIIIHVLNSQFGGCCNAHHCFAVSCSYLTQRPIICHCWGIKSKYCRSTCMSTHLFLNGVAGLYSSYSMFWIHNLAVATMSITDFCCFLFLFLDPESIICHLWGIKSKWLQKHMYEYQLIFKWCSWSPLIIIHVLNSQFGGCCNAHHCFAVSCLHIWPRGHHLPLVRNQVKVTKEPHVWVPTYF
jgi:hypothetical protein